MKNTDQIHDDLLARYLAQEASPDEISQVEAWIGASPANKAAFEDFKKIWEQTPTLKQPFEVDTDLAWQKVNKRIHRPETVIRPLLTQQKTTKRIIQIAASVVILLSITFVAYQFFTPKPSPKVLATKEFHLEQKLPDGTLVYLNANSELDYPANFDNNIRKVTLKGEAFFQVTPDASKPFVIEANGTNIRVLGTSFNVRAYDKNVKVNVETGKVAFGTTKRQVLLVKGEAATFEAKSDTIIKINQPNKNVLAYKTKLFLFEQTPLADVIQLLNEAYQSNIVLKNKKLAQCKLTTNFNNEDIETILAIIAETFDLQVEQTNGKITLDGKGCQ